MSLFRREPKRDQFGVSCSDHGPCPDPVQFPINDELTTVLCVPGSPGQTRKSAMVVPQHVSERWDHPNGRVRPIHGDL